MKKASYKDFASVYDIFMQNVDYVALYKYLKAVWRKFGVNPLLLLDLGCGTGELSILAAKDGYEVIGVDASAEMLAKAQEKAAFNNASVLFLNQRMQDLELYGTVDCIFSFLDCVNYVLKPNELSHVFALAHNYLNYGGLFVFDVLTQYNYEKTLADNTFAAQTGECAYIWENFYDKKRKINEYALSLFIKSGELYEKSTEYHYQRAYCTGFLSRTLKSTGFSVAGVFDAYTFRAPHKKSKRLIFVARKDCRYGK